MAFGKHAHEGHEHGGDEGGALIRGARRYEWSAAVGMLGRRRQVYDGLVALSGIGRGDRVLDIGCGTGYLTRRVARAVGAAGAVVGIDPSPSVVAYASTRSPVNCTFEVAGAQALPHADASFDAVVSSLAIHHLPAEDRVAAVREMRRVLRPGGRILLADFREQPRHLRVANVFGVLARHARQHHAMADLADLVERAGFEVAGSGDRWPSLRYVQARRPATDPSADAEGSRP